MTPAPSREFVALSTGALPLAVVRSPRARRYLLRLNPDRTVRLTIPRGGSLAHGQAFLERNIPWLERAAARLAARPTLPREWRVGAEIHWRGDRVTVQALPGENRILLAAEIIPVADPAADLRPAIEHHLRRLAARELPPIVLEYARQHSVTVRRVQIRSQRSRWGSCSRHGAISLNWRILQAPLFVRDYLILHELMHLREMNHSSRFWAHVATVCPGYQTAERWLSQHSFLLHS